MLRWLVATMVVLVAGTVWAQETGPGYALGMRVISRDPIWVDPANPGGTTTPSGTAPNPAYAAHRVTLLTHTFTLYDTTGEVFASLVTLGRAQGANLAAQQDAERQLEQHPEQMTATGHASYTVAQAIPGELDRFTLRLGTGSGGSGLFAGEKDRFDLPNDPRRLLGFELIKGFGHWNFLDDRLNLAIWAGGVLDLYTEHGFLETIDVLGYLQDPLHLVKPTPTSGIFEYSRIALPAGGTLTFFPVDKVAVQGEVGADLIVSLLRRFVSKNPSSKANWLDLPRAELRGIFTPIPEVLIHADVGYSRAVTNHDNDTRYTQVIDLSAGAAWLF